MIIKALIYVYRYALRWAFPPSCRFFPSCSQYSLEAIEVHGILRGGFLMIFRLLRCHPFSKEGIVDPVPPPRVRMGLLRMDG